MAILGNRHIAQYQYGFSSEPAGHRRVRHTGQFRTLADSSSSIPQPYAGAVDPSEVIHSSKSVRADADGGSVSALMSPDAFEASGAFGLRVELIAWRGCCLAGCQHRRWLGRRTMRTGSCPSTSTVAFRWGFPDHANFRRAFRRRYGCSPREYRQRLLAGQAAESGR